LKLHRCRFSETARQGENPRTNLPAHVGEATPPKVGTLNKARRDRLNLQDVGYVLKRFTIQPAWVAVAFLALIWVELGGFDTVKDLVSNTAYRISRSIGGSKPEAAAPGGGGGIDYDFTDKLKAMDEGPLPPVKAASN
jgi:hypothetical protein